MHWTMQVTLWNLPWTDCQLGIMITSISHYISQGLPQGICWMDGEGNELPESLGVGDVELYQEGEELPTLAIDTNNGGIVQVGGTEKLPFICELPSTGREGQC